MLFSIMDQTGHTAESFDTANKVSLDEAMKRFDELTKGTTDKPVRMTPAARYEKGGPANVKRTFDPNAIEYVFFPPMQGG